ncbi:reverse transcriptase family protein [Kineococcus gynurae]|uniref:RNA-directed DNA polymerase n=1 Tax=Kineococcus gynurae TaxID=452979 RepID=A0ABV5LPW0_9ACTN
MKGHDPTHALAVALADGALAGAWVPAAIATRMRTVLGGRGRTWLPALAADLCAEHPAAPGDAPRALAREIGAHPRFLRACATARARGNPLHVRHVLVSGTRMGRRRWPVPELDGVLDLAEFLEIDPEELDWFADVRGLQRRAPGTALHHYRSRWWAKPGAPRLLEVPKPRLKALQRKLLREVLDVVPPHPAAHGFVRGRSAVTGAREHVGSEVVLRFDLAAFFASISAARVYGRFRVLGYPEEVAHLLAGLCTHRTPLVVLRQMPDGGRAEDRFRLRRDLGFPHLPQGAPTSPALANLCAHGLDRRLSGLASTWGATYTRYADDLVLSGSGDLRAPQLRATLQQIVTEEGFGLNPAKTLVRGAGARQVVTGLVVNAGPRVRRSEVDRLRAILHNAVRSGPQSQNRDGHPDFRAHLLGRIAWVGAADPARGERLRETFQRIEWPG